jgi:hypothetical protein
VRHHLQKVLARQGHAAFGGLQAACRDMHEDGAAGCCSPRTPVVGDDDDDIVEPVAAPEMLRTCRIGMLDAAVVVAVVRCVAPSVVRPGRGEGEARARPREFVAAVEGAFEPKAGFSRRFYGW